MLSARRFSLRLVRWTGLYVCFALILASVPLVTPISSASGFKPQARKAQPDNGKGKKVTPAPPLPGAPVANLPNLEEARQRVPIEPQARQSIPSVLRSRRKPIESRRGRKVGDPLPRPNQRTGNTISGNGGPSVTAKDRVGIRSHHARRSRALNLMAAPMPQSGGAQNVIWTNVVGVSPSGNSLTKTAGDGWGNAGAASTQAIASGDGYVEFTASETSTWRMCGLSHGDSDQNYTDIDFAMYPTGSGSGSHVYIYEAGTYRGDFGAYSSGDRLRVAVDGGVVKYSRNGTVFYTSTVAPTYPLLVDTSLYSTGSTITDAVIGPISGDGGSFSDGYTQNFIYWALQRQPTADEVNYWEDMFRVAHAHQQGSLTVAVREMARTMFESAEYAARGRNNHQYVYDLYETYLMRYPDADGWAFWEGQCNSYGREQVRRAFDECGEFATDVAAINPSGSPSSSVSSLLSARVDPNNQPGDQLLARDAEWGVSLLSLPGRAGLDLGLGLSYSSASTWTRSGPYVYFDEDIGSPSPGFRLGFPVVQEVYFDAQVGLNVRPMIMPSGQRVEFRQVGASNVYEAADSSYLQLIDYGSSLLVRSTDGTQMSYAKFLDWRCTQIEDRNGNLITITNDWRGDIQYIVDTLGRTVVFNYDANANLSSITQNGRTQPWATFVWSTISMQPSFASSQVVGTYSGEAIPVLTQVSIADGSHYNFEYDANGQVNLIRRYTSDNAQRSYLAYNYESPSNDSPRVSASRVWAENWTGVHDLPTEVVTQVSDPGDGSHVMTAPDGTIYKEFYGTGWQRGLTTQSEVWSGGVRQKWTATAWTQDNTTVSYQTNPRVAETNIYDMAGNRSRTTTGYYAFTLPTGVSCSLPSDSYEYQADAVNVARHSHTDYNLDANYLNKRIIGLPQARLLYQGVSALMSKTTYVYDWSGEYLQGLPATPTQHDGSYSTDVWLGRANLVDVLRWDVSDPDNTGKALESKKMGYDIDGSAIFTRDALNHQGSISYSDSFSDGNNSRNSFAYPTTLTDADGYSAFIQYSFDLGAKTRSQGSNGGVQTFTYDSAARVVQMTTVNTSAYTRFDYGPNYTQSLSSINNVADEAYSVQYFDGAGRTILAGGNHPGSTGGYRLVNSIYDVMGRLVQQSNPTETNGNHVAVGDDAAGWVYTQQTYDWKGRPLLTTHVTDGTTKQASYSACGCAGSEVTTLTDEVGRQQRVYSDVFGRTAKTEVLNWDSTSTVYSTTVNAYNARDQLTQVRQFQGSDQSGVYQDTTTTFDGYGRLASKRVPEQNAGAATVYAYNPDDTTQSVTDGRGATCTYSYNNRQQVTSATHTLSGQATIALSYGYDAAGNRTSMSDSQGTTSYNYDSLSRMTSETRYFSALSSSSTGGNYGISYQYNLANELTSVTDPFGAQMTYNRDAAGRVTSVTGAGFLNISNYASSIQYRAWGGPKSVTYGDGTSATTSYNSRMQPSSYQLPGLREQFQYYDDGRLHQMTDLDDRGQDIGYPDTARHFSRAQSYDQVGRLVSASGNPSTSLSLPYNQSYSYDEFGNSTSRSGTYYYQNYSSDSGTFQNNRRQDLNYDADGNVTHTPSYNYAGGSIVAFRDWTYDAAGLISQVKETVTANNNSVSTYVTSNDGDGQPAIEYYQENPTYSKIYMVHSSVMGGKVLTRLDYAGNKWKTDFNVDGLLTAVQWGVSYASSYASMQWTHVDPQGLSEAGDTKAVHDPMGNYVQWQHAPTGPPIAYQPIASSSGGLGPNFGYAINSSCVLDGIPTDCSLALSNLAHGSAAQCRNNDCGPQIVRDSAGNQRMVPLSTNPDTGSLGYRYWDPTKPREQPSNDDDIIRINNKGRYVWKDAETAVFDFLGIGPQNTDSKDKGLKCPPVPVMPEGVSIEGNVGNAAAHYRAATQRSPFDPDPGARLVGHVAWFAGMVAPHGPWDYKQRDVKGGTYISFGNFNFGAVGMAAGFNEGQLLRAAGEVQYWAGNVPGSGGAVNIINALTGTGGQAPFLDEAVDQENVKAGINWYRHKFVLKDCY